MYFALLCTPETASACGARQNKDREIKEGKKCDGILPILLETHFIEGRGKLPSLRILALQIPLLPAAKVMEQRRTEERKQ